MKKIILTLITSVLFSSSVALAECNFIINIGDKSTKIIKKYGQPMPMFQGQFMMPIPSTEVCPNDKLNDEIAVEFIFLGETITLLKSVGIFIVAVGVVFASGILEKVLSTLTK